MCVFTSQVIIQPRFRLNRGKDLQDEKENPDHSDLTQIQPVARVVRLLIIAHRRIRIGYQIEKEDGKLLCGRKQIEQQIVG
jgi:hypothetical protein